MTLCCWTSRDLSTALRLVRPTQFMRTRLVVFTLFKFQSLWLLVSCNFSLVVVGSICRFPAFEFGEMTSPSSPTCNSNKDYSCKGLFCPLCSVHRVQTNESDGLLNSAWKLPSSPIYYSVTSQYSNSDLVTDEWIKTFKTVCERGTDDITSLKE